MSEATQQWNDSAPPSKFLSIAGGQTTRIRFMTDYIKWNQTFDDGEEAPRYAAIVIHKEVIDGQPVKTVKGFRYSWAVYREIQKIAQSGWGDPKGFDMNVIREGEGLGTKWTVVGIPNARSPSTDEEKKLVLEANLDLIAMYEVDKYGGLVQGKAQGVPADAGETAMNPEDYDPFADE